MADSNDKHSSTINEIDRLLRGEKDASSPGTSTDPKLIEAQRQAEQLGKQGAEAFAKFQADAGRLDKKIAHANAVRDKASQQLTQDMQKIPEWQKEPKRPPLTGQALIAEIDALIQPGPVRPTTTQKSPGAKPTGKGR